MTLNKNKKQAAKMPAEQEGRTEDTNAIPEDKATANDAVGSPEKTSHKKKILKKAQQGLDKLIDPTERFYILGYN